VKANTPSTAKADASQNRAAQTETHTAAASGLKRTWFQTDRQYQFACLVQEAAGDDVRFSEAFDAWLECVYLALRQPVFKLQTGSIDAATEERYLTVIRRMANPNKVAEAVAILVVALESRAEDFLGSVYSCMSMADVAGMGQCFTPTVVCELIAQFNFGDRKPDPTHRITICDPCCGGGSMLIAAAEHLKNQGFTPQNYHVWAQDLSKVCFWMTYVQLSLLEIPASVACGNSLTQKTSIVAPTFAGALFPYREEPKRESGELLRAA